MQEKFERMGFALEDIIRVLHNTPKGERDPEIFNIACVGLGRTIEEEMVSWSKAAFDWPEVRTALVRVKFINPKTCPQGHRRDEDGFFTMAFMRNYKTGAPELRVESGWYWTYNENGTPFDNAPHIAELYFVKEGFLGR
jgi:hypothetical protein